MAKKISISTIEREVAKQSDGNFSNREKINKGKKQFI